MITKTELNDVWNAITPARGKNIGRRADVSHPLDFFITYDEKARKQLTLLTDAALDIPKSSKQITVRGNERLDGKFIIGFSLEDSNLNDLYISLCWDLMDCTYSIQNKRKGVKIALNRFKRWQKLFASITENGLSDIQVKGLLGELLVLKNVCIPVFGITAIGGWVGPTGADRDFEYEDVWLESKIVSLSRSDVQISSLDQLDIDQPGFLIICRIEHAGENAPDSCCVNDLVKQIKEKIAQDENVATSFMNKLLLYGYREDDEKCDAQYSLKRMDYYCVNETFPRLRRSSMSSAISNGMYTISIPSIGAWKQESIIDIIGGGNAVI